MAIASVAENPRPQPDATRAKKCPKHLGGGIGQRPSKYECNEIVYQAYSRYISAWYISVWSSNISLTLSMENLHQHQSGRTPNLSLPHIFRTLQQSRARLRRVRRSHRLRVVKVVVRLSIRGERPSGRPERAQYGQLATASVEENPQPQLDPTASHQAQLQCFAHARQGSRGGSFAITLVSAAFARTHSS